MASRKVVRDLFFSKSLLLPRKVSYGRLVPLNGRLVRREFRVLNDFSKKINKGEIESNPGLQESIKEMKLKAKEMKEKAEGFKGVKDDLKVRTKQKTEKLYKYVDGVWTDIEKNTQTDIVVVPSKQSPSSKKWEAFKNKMSSHTVFKLVSGITEPLIKKWQEIAEYIREIKEGTEPEGYRPMKDYNEIPLHDPYNMTYEEISRRDPDFSLPEFLTEIQQVVKPVLNAYFKGNSEVLEKYCSSHVIERCKAEHKAYESQGIYFDKKILHVSGVKFRETKILWGTPLIIVEFQTQQIYCIRDRLGAITEGGQDNIQCVNYAWAMQPLESDEVGNGAPPFSIWKLRDIQELGAKAVI